MSPELDDQGVDGALGQLPPRDLDPWRREQIRRKAHAELQRQAALARHPWLARLSLTYDRVLEPTFVVGLSCAYLVWAFHTASQILAR